MIIYDWGLSVLFSFVVQAVSTITICALRNIDVKYIQVSYKKHMLGTHLSLSLSSRVHQLYIYIHTNISVCEYVCMHVCMRVRTYAYTPLGPHPPEGEALIRQFSLVLQLIVMIQLLQLLLADSSDVAVAVDS